MTLCPCECESDCVCERAGECDCESDCKDMSVRLFPSLSYTPKLLFPIGCLWYRMDMRSVEYIYAKLDATELLAHAFTCISNALTARKPASQPARDRKSVASGKRGGSCVDLGGRRTIKQKINPKVSNIKIKK